MQLSSARAKKSIFCAAKCVEYYAKRYLCVKLFICNFLFVVKIELNVCNVLSVSINNKMILSRFSL